MTLQSLRVAALVCALSSALAVGATSVAPAVSTGGSKAVTLPMSADFAAGSSVLSREAQAQLDVEMARFKRGALYSVLVTGFANTADSKHREALGLERARSIRAFFVLNGVDLSRVHIDFVDFTEQRNGRPGQVQFEVAEKHAG